MTPPGSSHETLRDPATARDERRQLDLTLGAAGVDAEDIDAARWVLHDRLARHSDDFAATTALQALNSYSAGRRADAASDAPRRVRNAGLSSVQRVRRSRARDTA